MGGGLQKIQEVQTEVGSKLKDFIEDINMLYPPRSFNTTRRIMRKPCSRRWTNSTPQVRDPFARRCNVLQSSLLLSFLAVSVNFNWFHIRLHLLWKILKFFQQCTKQTLHKKCWVLDCVLVSCECGTGLPSGSGLLRVIYFASL